MKKIILAIATIATMASCSKTESVEATDNWNGELRISSGITTRASGTMWDSNDAIGVFMCYTGLYDPVGDHNTKYITTSDSDLTYASATFLVASGVADLYYPQSTNVDIIAHYPYNNETDKDGDAKATVTTYPIDVTAQTTPKNIDFMSAKLGNVAKSSTALKLEFYHMLSQLNITLTPAEDGGLTTDNLKEATITVQGTMVTADAALTYSYDTENEVYIPLAKFTTSGTATDLTLAASNSVATFIVVPQTADVTFSITVTDIGEFHVTLSEMTLESGKEYNYTISVSRTAAKIEGATIIGWGNGDEDNTDEDKDYGELNANDL